RHGRRARRHRGAAGAAPSPRHRVPALGDRARGGVALHVSSGGGARAHPRGAGARAARAAPPHPRAPAAVGADLPRRAPDREPRPERRGCRVPARLLVRVRAGTSLPQGDRLHGQRAPAARAARVRAGRLPPARGAAATGDGGVRPAPPRRARAGTALLAALAWGCAGAPPSPPPPLTPPTSALPAADPLAELRVPPLAGAQWGVLAVDVATGDTLLAEAAGRRLIPG